MHALTATLKETFFFIIYVYLHPDAAHADWLGYTHLYFQMLYVFFLMCHSTSQHKDLNDAA